MLDSNICIYILSDAESAPAIKLGRCRKGAVSAISYAEIMLGIERQVPDGSSKTLRLFDSVAVLPFDAAASLAYARLPFKRAKFDRLIAAHAIAIGATLVTNNPSDFADIPDLSHVDWA